MSKKIARSRDFFLKNWTAAIAGSLLLFSAQSSRAADESRPNFRAFRDLNPGVDRKVLRDMYRYTVRESSSEKFSICPITINPDSSSSHRNIASPSVNDASLRGVEHTRRLNQSMQMTGNGSSVRLRSGVDLDLSASTRNITLGEKLLQGVGSVEIVVAGEKKVLTAGSEITPAEYIAVKQILAGSGQTLVIGRDGSASGGNLDLSSITLNNDAMRASNLVVPANVTTRGDFSRGSDFRLTGDLSNYGTIQAFDADGRGRGGAIRAHDILNARDGQITSEVDLALLASGNLTNLGTINSRGSLTLSAGGTVKNSSNVTAGKDLNISAPNVENSGVLVSQNGNVSVDGPADAALTINNIGGSIEALNGAINVRNVAYDGTFDTTISGGDLLSKELNLNAGQGTVNVFVDDLTGTVNETGFASHILASTEVLTLGKICLTGDPLYLNDSGSIVFGTSLQVAENLTVVARDDISVNSGAVIAANSASQGYDITFIAGANITSTVGGVTIDGTSSAGGGKITLGSGSYVWTRPIDGPGSANGGNISMFAFRGSALNSGTVDLSAGAVIADGLNSGSAGNFTLVAGGQNVGVNHAVSLGSMSLGSSGAINSTVSVTTAQPTTSGGAITYDASGNRTSGAQLVSDGNINSDAGVGIDSYIVAGNVNVQAGDYIRASASSSLIANSVNLLAGANGVGEETSYILINVASASQLHVGANSQGGDVWLACVSTTVPLFLEASTGNHHYTVSNPYVPTTLSGAISGTGTFTLTTSSSSPSIPALDMGNKAISFHDILVQSPTGSDLYIYGGGVSGTFNTNVAGTTTFLAPDQTLKLSGLNFNGGDAIMTADVINNDAQLKGSFTNNLTLNTCNFIGGGTTPDWASVQIICDAGTIANSSGDINLPDNLVFHGKDLAILAYGNVNTTGATLIDLSDATGTGGNLTIMAGYSFSPSTSGQQQSEAQYTIDGGNPSGGNVNLGNVDVNTTGGAGFASGNVTIVANVGPTPGVVSIGNIDTSGTIGGSVKVISAGSIVAGNINTTGSTTPGSITLANSIPTISGGPILVQDGVVSNGTFEIGANSAGNMSFANILATNANVSLYGAYSGADAIGQNSGSSLIANRLIVNMGDGVAIFGLGTTSTDVNRLQVSSSGSGILRLYNELNTIGIEASSAPNLTLQVIAADNLDVRGNVTAGSVSLTSNNGNINLFANLTLAADTISLSTSDQITSTPTGLISAANSLALASKTHLRSNDLGGGFSGGFQTLTLFSQNGNIGTDASNRFVVNQDGPLTIDATAGNGSIFLHTDNTQSVSLNSILTGGTFNYSNGVGNGSVDIHVVDAGTDVVINVTGNTLNIAPNADISTNTGNILIANNGTNKKTDFFNIGNGSTIEALAATPGLGNVTLTMGPVPVPVLQKKTFSKKTISYTESGGGLVYWGKKKWEAKTGPITITAKGADVTFSNAFSKKNAVIGSNVTITADPPVPENSEVITAAVETASSIKENFQEALSLPLASLAGDVKVLNLVPLPNSISESNQMLSNQFTNLATSSELNLQMANRSAGDDSFIKPATPLQVETDADVYSEIALLCGLEGGSASRACHPQMTFEQGSALFVPSCDTMVETPKGTVKIGAGSVAFVVLSDQQLAVYDLHDTHKCSITVETCDRSFTLAPGRHLLVGQGDVNVYSDVNPVECLMHRNIVKNDLQHGNWVFTSEFSVPYAVQAIKPLRAVMHSSDTRARSVANRMIKTAAILSHLTGANGQFEFHPKPRKLASR